MGELRVDPLSGLRTLLGDDAPPLTPDAPEPQREASLDLYTSRATRGAYEVIAHAARPVTTLAELEPDELVAAMARWRERMAAHPEAAHVHLHVDEGAGPSEAQLWALDFVPAAIARERERSAAYATRTQGSDLLGDLVQSEVRGRTRLVGYDAEA